MRHFKYLLLFLVSVTLILTTNPAVAADLECTQDTLNFGQVEIGTSSSLIITCTAQVAGYTIQGVTADGGAGDFTFQPQEGVSWPYTLAEGESVDVNVEFTPTIVGNYQAGYNISGTFGYGYWYELGMMQGDGVIVQPPLPEDTQAILDFIDDSVEAGDLTGEGPGASADNRLNALITMIEAAGEMTTFGITLNERPLYVAEGNQLDPRISGNRVVFTNMPDGDIYLGDVNTGEFVNATSSADREFLNDIDGNRIVYTRLTDEGGRDVVMKDFTDPDNPVTTVVLEPREDQLPRIDGDIVVFEVRRSALDIYAYDFSQMSAGVFPIANGEGDQVDPAISNKRVVYVNEGVITLFDFSIEGMLPTTTIIGNGMQPDIDGDYVVYSGEDSTCVGCGFDVLLYEISTGITTNITHRAGDQLDPSISGNFVGYEDWSTDNSDIYLYLIENDLTVRVTTDSAYQFLQDVGNGHLVYTDNRNGNEDIYVTDFSITTSQGACEQLSAALKKCDGEPEDFVEGDARVDLYDMIMDIMISIGCD
jgi:hypothetical protein